MTVSGALGGYTQTLGSSHRLAWEVPHPPHHCTDHSWLQLESAPRVARAPLPSLPWRPRQDPWLPGPVLLALKAKRLESRWPRTLCVSECVPQEGASKRRRLHPQAANAHLWLTVVLTAFQNQNSKIEVVWAAPASSQLGPLQMYRPLLGLSLEHVKRCPAPTHLGLLCIQEAAPM